MAHTLGFAGKASVHLQLETPTCAATELLIGTLSVRVNQPVACSEIVVIVAGNERVAWTEAWAEKEAAGHSEMIFDGREFFRQKIVLCSVESELAPGHYAYPFQYRLPAGLPGSYDNENDQDVQAIIEYGVEGALCVRGVLAQDASDRHAFTMYAVPSLSETPSVAEKVQLLHSFCCLRHGQCTLRVALDKCAYGLGQVPIVQCDVKNSSTKDMRAMRFELVRVVEVFARGRIRSLQTVLCDELFSGVPAGRVLSQPQPFSLHGRGLYPSTSGNFVSCSYYIEVDFDIPTCPIVELRLPLTIGAPVPDAISPPQPLPYK